jgi:glycosyltransferase involved in cell wall biosynthesis
MKKFLFLFTIGTSIITSIALHGENTDYCRIINSLPSLIDGERRIAVIIPSYNNQDWYQRNLDSVFNQNYHNYYVIYIDDCSNDETYGLVKSYIEQNEKNSRTILIHNNERRRALANLYNAIHLCNKKDIIIILDGDDFLADDNVFLYLNKVYSDTNIWLTYGQFREWPNGALGFCQSYTKDIIDNNAFRRVRSGPSHLRTFYAGLFQKIKKEDLMMEDDFFPMTYDLALMFPMLEMAGKNHKFIRKVMLKYNTSNPINDHKVSKDLQIKCDNIIRKLPRYDKIENPF